MILCYRDENMRISRMYIGREMVGTDNTRSGRMKDVSVPQLVKIQNKLQRHRPPYIII